MEVNDPRFQKSLHLGIDHIKRYCHLTNELLSGRGAEEPTVYGWNTKVSTPLLRRWVVYNKKVHLNYDGSMVPAEWFGWLHYKTDKNPIDHVSFISIYLF